MIIGLTQRILYHKDRPHDSIEHGWYSYLKNHSIVLVQNHLTQDFTNLANNIDSLIITGGDDSPQRRTVELKLASEMMKLHKPILGICHGAFLLTDVLGGNLIQDNNHMDTEHVIWYHNESKTVNSFHSNTIKNPHSTAQILAVDDNNNCESWIDNNLAGIVWHPERMLNPWIPTEISNKFLI